MGQSTVSSMLWTWQLENGDWVFIVQKSPSNVSELHKLLNYKQIRKFSNFPLEKKRIFFYFGYCKFKIKLKFEKYS